MNERLSKSNRLTNSQARTSHPRIFITSNYVSNYGIKWLAWVYRSKPCRTLPRGETFNNNIPRAQVLFTLVWTPRHCLYCIPTGYRKIFGTENYALCLFTISKWKMFLFCTWRLTIRFIVSITNVISCFPNMFLTMNPTGGRTATIGFPFKSEKLTLRKRFWYHIDMIQIDIIYR